MKKLVQWNARLIKNNHGLLGIAIATLLMVFYYAQRYYKVFAFLSQAEIPLIYIRVLLRFSPLLFMLFAVLSLHMALEPKTRSMDEVLHTTALGEGQYLFSLFSSNAILLGVVCAILSITFFASMAIFESTRIVLLDGTLVSYILFLFFVNFFLIGILGILFGILLSKVKSKGVAFLTLVIVFVLSFGLGFLPSDIVYSVFGLLPMKLYDLLRIGPAANDGLIVEPFGIGVQYFHVARILFWIFLFSFLLLPGFKREKNRKRQVLKASLGILAVVSFIVYILPASNVDLESRTYTSFMEDFHYYQTQTVDEIEAPFTYTQVDIRGTIARKLNAEVTLSLDTPQRGKVPFTLYHGYQVKKVLDRQNNPVSFSQESDYIWVELEDASDAVTFIYDGYSPKFYSNEQGVFLPSHFPWFPQPGHQKVFELQNGGGFAGNEPLPKIPIHIEMESRLNLFSNVEQVNDHTWNGTAEGVTLLGGFYEEGQWKESKIVFPVFDTLTFPRNQWEEMMAKDFEENELPEDKDIFIIPNMNFLTPHENLIIYDDYMLLTSLGSYPDLVNIVKSAPEKTEVARLLELYLNDRATYDERLQMAQNEIVFWENENMPERADEYRSDIYYLFSKLVTDDEERTIEQVENYLNDETDHSDQQVFFHDLLKERGIQ